MKFLQLNDLFQVYRKIFCSCPCGGVFRLSDAQVVSLKHEVPKDWLSKLEFARDRLGAQVERAEEKFQEKKGKVLELHRRAAQRLCHKAVETVIPRFTSLKLNTNDIKSIFSPVKFVAFDGLCEKNVRRICLLDTEPESSQQERIHEGIRKSIKAGNVTWGTIRVGDDGVVKRE